MIGGALPLMRVDLPMTDAGAGWLIGTAFALPYGVTALVLATILRGRRASLWWLIGGVTIWTAATLVTGAAQSTATLMLARAGLGIGQAMFVPVAIAWLVDVAGIDGRARALSLFTSGSTIGRSTALLTIGALLSALTVITPGNSASALGGIAHWRLLFMITALPNIVMIPLLAGLRKRDTRHRSVEPAFDNPMPDLLPSPSTTALRAPPRASAHAGVQWWTIALFFAAAIMPIMLIQAMGAWLPTLFVRDRGILPAQAAMLLGAIMLFTAPAGQLAGGWLMTRYASWHRHVPAIILVSLIATLLPLSALVWAPGLAGAAVGVAIANLTLGIASFCGLFGVQMLSPVSARITVNGIFFALVTLVGVGIGPLLTGALATFAHSGPATIGAGTMSPVGALGTALFTTGVIASCVCAMAVGAVRYRYRQHCAA